VETGPPPVSRSSQVTGELAEAHRVAKPAVDSPDPLDEWKPPQLVLVTTGRQDGYIEPCGCTGLDNQKGGLARRAALIGQLRRRGWPLVPVDVGNQVRRFGRQPEIKFQTTVNALKELGYKAIAPGPDDLRLSVGELLAAATNPPNPFVSSNVNLFDLVPPVQIVEAGGVKVGITAVLGAEEWQKVNSSELEFREPAAGLGEAKRFLEQQGCQLLVLLSHASIEETRRLVQATPGFHLAITAGGASEPALMPEQVQGTDCQLVQVGAKGMYAGVIGVYQVDPVRLRYERVALDARFRDSPEVLQSLAAYQQQLEALGLEGLGLRPVAHPSGRQFVGSQVCGDCHTSAYAVWETTPHQRATEDIVHPTERSSIPRHFDPECLSCHVTGWNPQGYYPYAGGYWDLESTPHLTGNGCENCHGPGSAHVAVETGEQEATDQQRLALRQQMRLPLAKAEQTCLECHDLDNSPDFHKPGAFEHYWKEVEHRGTD
jgi:hypothetical protein